MNESYDPRQRMAEARERLRDALTPSNDQEHAIVDWLCGFIDLPTAETLALLIERATSTAYEQGKSSAELDIYDLGFNAGARAARERIGGAA